MLASRFFRSQGLTLSCSYCIKSADRQHASSDPTPAAVRHVEATLTSSFPCVCFFTIFFSPNFPYRLTIPEYSLSSTFRSPTEPRFLSWTKQPTAASSVPPQENTMTVIKKQGPAWSYLYRRHKGAWKEYVRHLESLHPFQAAGAFRQKTTALSSYPTLEETDAKYILYTYIYLQLNSQIL